MPYLSKNEESILRSIKGESLSGVPVDSLNCPFHKYEYYSKYCYTDKKPVCEKCAIMRPMPNAYKDSEDRKKEEEGPQPEYHVGHHMKNLNVLVDQLLKQKQDLKQQIKREFEKIDAAVEYFTGIEDIFTKQKALYLQKLAADFEVIRKLVERKYIELKDKIESIYEDNLQTAYRYIDGLTAIKQSVN